MSAETTVFAGGPIFDGQRLLDEHCVEFSGGICSAIVPENTCAYSDSVVQLNGNIFSPGYTDLQVNGGGGVMFNDNPTVKTLKIIASAHHSLGTRYFLPTLITSTKDNTRAAIRATVDAMGAGVPGIAGLHLEGPHLSIEKKGAHLDELIRPMQDDDLDQALVAAEELPLLKMTVAPENVSLKQVHALNEAGVLLALGHTNANYATCLDYAKAGVQGVTHLFNAMSQFGSREPGLVGACLNNDHFSVGLIADGVHVHPYSISTAIKLSLIHI